MAQALVNRFSVEFSPAARAAKILGWIFTAWHASVRCYETGELFLRQFSRADSIMVRCQETN